MSTAQEINTDATTAVDATSPVKYPIIDTDVHVYGLGTPDVNDRLPQRWKNYVAEYGLVRPGSPGGDRPRQREFAARWDTVPPEGGLPMSNPDFAREQLLDRYDTTVAILNDIGAFSMNGARDTPRQLAAAACSAINENLMENWFARDERWHGAIATPYEVPDRAVAEIERLMQDKQYRSRWNQVMIAPDNMNPPGHEMYYPIYEICQEYDLPINIHVAAQHRITPSGSSNYYFEEHSTWAGNNFPIISSLIFEGVFDRFPNLKIVHIELGWTWVAPFAWRLDNAYRLFQSEVPHLTKLPSEYLRDHFWFTTQPMEEPEQDKWNTEIFEVLEASGMGDKLMYSSDYPHWDFDEPAALPSALSPEQRRKILGETASKLYKIPLKPNSGVILP